MLAMVPVPVVAGDCVRCAHYLGAVVPSIRWDDAQGGGSGSQFFCHPAKFSAGMTPRGREL